jgi:hypothetical protein
VNVSSKAGCCFIANFEIDYCHTRHKAWTVSVVLWAGSDGKRVEVHWRNSKNRFVSPEERKIVLEKRLTTVDTADVDLDDDEQDRDADVEELDYENEDDNSKKRMMFLPNGNNLWRICRRTRMKVTRLRKIARKKLWKWRIHTQFTLPVYECYEETDEESEPLPEENIPKYPQENKVYFASKKKGKNYVRSDKMSLHDFHDIIDRVKAYNTKEFPCVRKIYSDTVYVEREGW